MQPEPVLAHLSADARLRPLLETLPFPQREASVQGIFHDLLQSIVSQQLSVKAAATIFGRFCALFPEGRPEKEALAAMPEEILCSVGLSRQKAAYVRNVAAFFAEQPEWEQAIPVLSDADILQRLTRIKGVGTWTVEMLLMFSLNRPDVFPLGDLGIQQGMKRLYGLEESGKALLREMERIAEPWRPYRSYACYYLWKWKDS
jgi:DNA-3-methyladenine glycosylase II